MKGSIVNVSSPTRRGSAFHAGLFALILLIIGSLICTFLAYYKYRLVNDIMHGTDNPEVGPEDLRHKEQCLTTQLKNQKTLQTEIETLNRQLTRKEDHLYSLDMRLAALRIAYDASGTLRLDPEADAAKPYSDEWTLTQKIIANRTEATRRWRDSHVNDRQKFTEMEKFIDDTRKQLADVMTKATAQDARFKAENDALQGQYDKISVETRDEDRKFREQEAMLQTKKGNLDTRIRELLELELRWLTELEPDGQVLQCNLDQRILIADLGSQAKVPRGLRLEVFQFDAGQFKHKGFVEVIEVQAHHATCRIIQEADHGRLPICKGDYLGNPVFDRNRPQVFALAGEFIRYNRADLVRFIGDAGGKVADKIGPGVDFLVCGGHSDPQKEEARQFQLRALTEDQLLPYIQPSFKPLTPAEIAARQKAAAKAKPPAPAEAKPSGEANREEAKP